MSDLVERLRARRVANWVHSTGDTPCCNGYALDAECIDAADTIEAQAERVRVLREALADAIVCVQDWSAYAAPYYLAKHDLNGDVKRLRAALDATQ